MQRWFARFVRGNIERTWIKIGICLVYFILQSKIINMKNLSHEWLHVHQLINKLKIKWSSRSHVTIQGNLIIFDHKIKYNRQMPRPDNSFFNHHCANLVRISYQMRKNNSHKISTAEAKLKQFFSGFICHPQV